MWSDTKETPPRQAGDGMDFESLRKLLAQPQPSQYQEQRSLTKQGRHTDWPPSEQGQKGRQRFAQQRSTFKAPTTSGNTIALGNSLVQVDNQTTVLQPYVKTCESSIQLAETVHRDATAAHKYSHVPFTLKHSISTTIIQQPGSSDTDQRKHTDTITSVESDTAAEHNPAPCQGVTGHTEALTRKEGVALVPLSQQRGWQTNTVTSTTGYVDTEHILEEMANLRKQLETETKVNTDLKKLLVASMGEDLHCRVESLVRTRAQLACEIGDYTKKMYEDYENIDQLSVEADMWRTKFVATRMLLDKVRKEKDQLTAATSTGVQAIQLLLKEYQQLRDSMLQTHRHLQILQASFQPAARDRSSASVPNILELCRSNMLLSSSLQRVLLGEPRVSASTTVSLDSCSGYTPAERHAHQFVTKEGASRPVMSLPTTTSTSVYSRLFPHVRYEGLTINCCGRCSGDIHVV